MSLIGRKNNRTWNPSNIYMYMTNWNTLIVRRGPKDQPNGQDVQQERNNIPHIRTSSYQWDVVHNLSVILRVETSGVDFFVDIFVLVQMYFENVVIIHVFASLISLMHVLRKKPPFDRNVKLWKLVNVRFCYIIMLLYLKNIWISLMYGFRKFNILLL